MKGTLNERNHFRRFVVPSACAAGVLLNVLAVCTFFAPQEGWRGNNDFVGFYAGARLVGTPNLYDRDAVRNVQLQAVGGIAEVQYGRLPFFALILKPLALLPYRTAYALWAVLLGLSFAGFIALWPGIEPTTKWLVCCSSLPPFASLFNGQDDLMLLLWTAIAVRLLRSERSIAAGMVLALCASKFHLFALVPLVILGQRRWRMAGGLAFGGCILFAVSFAAAGKSWPLNFYATLTDARISTGLDQMPNLHSLLGMGTFGLPLQIVGSLMLAAGVFLAARCTSEFERPLALALVAGVLTGFHGYLADCALFLPAIMVLYSASYARRLAMILVSPLPWMLLQDPKPFPALTQLLIIALAGAVFLSIVRTGNTATDGMS